MKKSFKVLLCATVLICAMHTGYTRAEEIQVGETREISSNITIDSIENHGTLSVLSDGKLTTRRLTNNRTTLNSGSIVADSIVNTRDTDFENNGAIDVSGNINNSGTIVNYGEFNVDGVLTNAVFINSGPDASLKADYIISSTSFTVTDGANINIGTLENYGRIELTNNSTLTLENQDIDIEGTLNVRLGDNTLTSSTDTCNIIEAVNIGDGINSTSLNLDNINVTEAAIVNIASNSVMNLKNGSSLTLNDGDSLHGSLILDGDGSVTFDNFAFESTELAYYGQKDGKLNLVNDSMLAIKDASKIKNGSISIDSTSAFIINGSSGVENSLSLKELHNTGIFSSINSVCEQFLVENLELKGTSIDNTAKFAIDIDARNNDADRFVGSKITDGCIEISDWNLVGDIYGWDAPIDKHINLDRIFNYDTLDGNVEFNVTDKEVFTPIGWYKLNGAPNSPGGMTLDLTRFNPQVYRGQVTTIAQWMNQLAIDDMLFNHSMVLPSFKEEDGGIAYGGMMANRYAAIDPQFAPYQYSRKDGGLWYKMYGTFETLQMSQGLSNVGNNAYGSIIGADFGLKELKNGWKFMPTAYIGYNGAHQYYSGLGAYQNGGQAGFLGTWYKNNFIIGGLVYGGVYQNSMDIAGHTDNTFNYFAGAATKAAYNWRFHRDWVLQPNLFLAYNFFGQQNWHSDFGQMGMMSGILNGINLAPGLNLIWEKETFSIYATLQYMYNLNGAVGGRAGNVGLPHLYMDRGYIQYGIGFTKRFTDRFSGYFQTVFRNVGRTGVGFQLGFNFLLGK